MKIQHTSYNRIAALSNHLSNNISYNMASITIDISTPPNTIWYLAIGSMINPISLSLRKITPLRSYPAYCPTWKVAFRGKSGMATLEKDENVTMHGVLHLLTLEHMNILDNIEAGYDRIQVSCYAYNDDNDNIHVIGTAYTMKPEIIENSKFEPDGLPSERYLDIITRGCIHYGVKESYINWLKSLQFVPRKKPSEYGSFHVADNLPLISMSEVSKNNGIDGNDCYTVLNNKVLKFIGDKSGHFYKISLRFAGKDCALSMVTNLYEPLYPIPSSLSEMTSDHRAYAEDMLFTFGATNWEVIGLLEPSKIYTDLLPETEWYLAIGAMINPISLKLRNLNPIRSYPAYTPGWGVAFKGVNGMASLVQDEKACMHGVAHLMTKEDMKVLDNIEMIYNRHPVKCHLYSNDSTEEAFVEATAYVVDESKVDNTKPDGNPSERYLEIIRLGCEHFGVRKTYIDWLNALPFTPRKKPEDFLAFAVPLDAPSMTFDEVAICNGEDGRDICTILNGKVLKYIGKKDGGPYQMSKQWGAEDCTFKISTIVYEPRYTIPTSRLDMSLEHCGFVEDLFYSFAHENWEMIAWYKKNDPLDSNLLQGTEWYLAIGSMINPVSLKLRNLNPLRSFAARAKGWQVVFKGLGGMASLKQDESACMHGVVHSMTSADMKALDDIESSYYRHPVTCTAYLPNSDEIITLEATAYIMNENKVDLTKPDGLPSERYIDIITRGCQYYNVDPEYICWLKSLPCVPRLKPDEYLEFALPDPCPEMLMSEVETYRGKTEGDILAVLNGKVIKFIGERSGFMFEMAKKRAGNDFTLNMSKMLYEPIYPVPTTLEAMPINHKRHVENMVHGKAPNTNWTAIAKIVKSK